VHWYNYNLHYYEVLSVLDETEIVVGETLTATVTWKDLIGTHVLSGARVYVGAMGPWGPETGTLVGTTGAQGTCTFSWSSVGTWGVYANDSVHGSGQYNWPYVAFTCRTGGQPDLEVNKIASSAGGTVGTDVEFSINVTNTGNCTLNPVRVVDTLPAGMSYVAAGTSPAPSSVVGKEVTWTNVSSLDPGDSTTITLIAHIDEGALGTLINNVTATGTPPYGADVHDSDTATVTVMGVSIAKSCSLGTVSPGGKVNYTIKYRNTGVADLHNVVITEHYPKGVTFISAFPTPDPKTTNKWTFITLAANTPGEINITVSVPESRNISFTETGSVTGEGFVMVNKELSTKQESYRIENVVTLLCAELPPLSASAFTTVGGVPGTSLEITEHGSGIYSSDEILNSHTKDKSIRLEKRTEVEYKPTSFRFSDGFITNFFSLWTHELCSKNYVTGVVIHKKISDATYIVDDTVSEVDNNSVYMGFESSFFGAAHIGTKSKFANTSEDYIGEFDLYWAEREECKYLFTWSRVPGDDSEKLIRFLVDTPDIKFYWAENATITKSSDDMTITICADGHTAEIIMAANKETATVKVGNAIVYVLEVRTEDGTLNVYDCRLKEMPESVSGVGFVMLDKELSKRQIRVIEHGSGIYSSDLDFNSRRLDKSTEAVFRPTSFNFSDGFVVNFSPKWMQSICSKDKKAGTAIQKKISYATAMEDDTNATVSTMKFESSLNGSIHIGVRTNNTKISEDYIGDFNVAQVIEISGENKTRQKEEEEEDWIGCP
jgi:uncharacterized repeat protein (TIGR01451 family)